MAEQPQDFKGVMEWLRAALSRMEFNETHQMPKAGIRILVNGYDEMRKEIHRLSALVDTLENKVTDSQNCEGSGMVQDESVEGDREVAGSDGALIMAPGARRPGRPRGPRRQVPATGTDTAE